MGILGYFTLSRKHGVINKVSTDAEGSHVFAFLCSDQFVLNIKSLFGLCVINIPSYLMWI